MSKFFTLLKVDLINSFALNQNSRKQRKTKKTSSLGLMIFVFAMFLLVSTMYSFMIGTLAKSSGRPEVVLTFGVSIGALTTLMMTFANAYGVLFKSKDFELLASLPIDSRLIVASKIASITIVGYAYFGLMFVPSCVIYIINTSFNIVFVLTSLVILLFGPLLITSICSFIAYLFGRIVSRFKYKNIITTILYVIFTIGLVGLIYYNSFTMPDETADAAAQTEYINRVSQTFTNIYPISYLTTNALLGNLLYLLYFVLIMVIPYALFVIIIGSRYQLINTNNLAGYKNSKFDLRLQKEYKTKGIIKTMLSKEFKTILSIPVYLLNVVMGPILSVVMVIAMCYMLLNNVGTFSGTEEAIPYYILPNIICMFSLFISGIAPASGCGISIEGKKFWIIKSLPIDANKFLISKLLFSFIIMSPLSLIGSIVGCIMIKATLLDTICIIIAPQIAAVLYSLIGLLINLKFYNLEWDNPTQAVKQGANVFLPMLIDFGVFLVVGAIFIVAITFSISLTWVMLMFVAILCLVFVLIYRKKAVKLYNRISA